MADPRTDERYPWFAGVVLALVLGAGCTTPGTIVTSIGADSTESVVGLTLGFTGAAADPTNGTITVARGDHELARGWAKAGTELPLSLDGHACALVSRGPFTYDDTDTRIEHPGTRPAGGPTVVARTYQRVAVTLRCADGPVPGTAGSLRGGNPRRAMLWMLPFALLAVIAGSFARSDRKGGERFGTAFLLVLVALGGAIALAWTRFDGTFRLTMTVVGVGAVIAGVVGGRLWHRRKPHASIAWTAGALLGSLPLVLLTPAWSYGGPLAALACAAGAAIIASVIAVMVKPLV